MSTADPPGRKLDRAAIERVVTAAGDRLSGDWVLVGGGLAVLWFDPRRLTEDVDLVSVGGSAGDRLALLDLAAALGLPVEAVNSAADFFLRKIDGWQTQLDPFRSGTSARILRPTPTLFLLLKIARLSEEDAVDCLGLIDRARVDGLPIDVERVLGAIDALAATDDAAVQRRRDRLKAAMLAFTRR